MAEPYTISIPASWANEQAISEADRMRIALLRVAGCECELPLLGCEMDGSEVAGPRCRLCNVRVRMVAAGHG